MSVSPVMLNKPTRPQPRTVGFKQSALLLGRLVATFVAMLLAFVMSSLVVKTNLPLSPEESSQAGPALLIVSFITSLVLAYPILASRWHGVKLMAWMFVIQFGVQTFMSQIETLYFIRALKIPMDVFIGIVASGFVRALIFAPLAVLLLSKFKAEKVPGEPPRLQMERLEWVKRFAILAIVYVVVYFGFGYFVAFQWVEARQYYAGTFSNDFTLPLFQLLRGVMWAALALPIVAMMRGRAWETCLAVALVFAGLLATGVLFPNPYMPAMVRQAHLFELSSSMLTYGVIAGWVWTRPYRQPIQKA